MPIQFPKSPQAIGSQFKGSKFLIYGDSGVGKSTLASGFPNPLFLSCENGLQYLPVYKMPQEGFFTDFVEFRAVVAELKNGIKAGALPFETVVVDTLDGLRDMITAKVCADHRKSHIREVGANGAGYDLVANQLKLVLADLVSLPCCVVFLSHVNRATDQKARAITRAEPNLSKSALDPVKNAVDFIFYLGTASEQASDQEKKGDQRVLHTKPSDYHTAKDRSGKLPAKMLWPEDLPADRMWQKIRLASEGRPLKRPIFSGGEWIEEVTSNQ